MADSGHHRVLELEVAGGRAAQPRARVVRVIGSGERGRSDGPLARASFDRPHGLALAGAPGAETLYIADTENHLVRAADLASGAVTTLVGTGEQARRANVAGQGRKVALSSPWDIALLDGALIVAMAGAHQLWRLDLATLAATPWVGTGREDISDGPAFRCTLAQPTGVHRVGARLFFADSESSAIRYVTRYEGVPDVTTIAGRGLFEFGDEDGKGGHVRLQHPYGVTAHGADLFVADTYNHKIKRLDAEGRATTFAGSGQAGLVDGFALEARFWQPQGVSAAGDLLFAADTDDHALRVIDLRAADGAIQVKTLALVE